MAIKKVKFLAVIGTADLLNKNDDGKRRNKADPF
jgi:hypothetical protein